MTESTQPPQLLGQPVKIEDEMRGAYLDYAMSVIIGRALPDVRDGFKPVHKRILFAMYDLGNYHNKPYKKSARVVGDVIGKYHPHGDSAVYDTMVRMAQDFSLRYPLVDGQGNFGSIDGDSAAAMRYTEVRMDRIADDILADIEKDTVDFGPNYDGSLQEPKVLPTRVPQLLINGSSGIAVGMATNIPPHNLNEIVDATIALVKNPKLQTGDLLQYVQGPDFPTAGYVFGGAGLRKAYETGRGIIMMRAHAEIEEWGKDRERIVVTEIPYQVNKAKLIEKIADLVRDKKVEGISDLRDESDRTGMRMVIDIKKGENSNIILNRLYKLTALQSSFGITLLAIHNNQPKVFNLRDMIWAFIEHRRDVVVRRTVYELRKAEARLHILEGLKVAVENIDDVVALIKNSKGPAEAKSGLIAKYDFSEIQAQAILDMRLQRLTGLEREKIIKEYEDILKLIADLKDILAHESRVFEIIESELIEVKEKYGDERRTKIVIEDAQEFGAEDLIADEETLVTITHRGYIKRSDLSNFKAQRRGGKGIIGMTTGDNDFVSSMFRTSAHSIMMCFTDKGRVHALKVYKVPEAGRTGKGKAIVNLLSLSAGEKIRAILPIKGYQTSDFFVLCSQKGYIKKTAVKEFKNIKAAGLVAVTLADGDDLVGVKVTNGNSDIFICTNNGQSIRFSEDDVRSMGRTARGVTAINLKGDDQVISLETLSNDQAHILMITEGGYGKRTSAAEYRVQGRGGQGIKSMGMSDRNGPVVSCWQVTDTDEVMIISSRGKMIRTKVAEISEQGRVAQGVRVMNLSPGEKVVATEILDDQATDDEDSGGNGSDSGDEPLKH